MLQERLTPNHTADMFASSRRAFLKASAAAGGGLLPTLTLPRLPKAAETKTGTVLNIYVRIAPDNTIMIVSKEPEIGQGIKTSLPMVPADELDADWNQVRIEQALADSTIYGRQVAGGGQALERCGQRMRNRRRPSDA
jgi:isoquinoline 1-oxidoreductase beta subunit